MPKTEIDYSNTIIYKITCKDETNKQVYVGHTTNFVQRKHAHKQSCNNDKASNYKCKLYEVIRANGGWNNWKMEIINFFECKDHYEARQREQEYFISLDATLNSIEPMPKPKVIEQNDTLVKKEIYVCNICDVKCSNNATFEKHNASSKHLKRAEIATGNQKETGLVQKVQQKYSCKLCDYTTSRSSQYSRHLLTMKHKRIQMETERGSSETHTDIKLQCTFCHKIYKQRSGLWKHNRKCFSDTNEQKIHDDNSKPTIDTENKDNVIDFLIKENLEFKNIILDVVKTNSDLQKQMIEVCKNNNIVNNNNYKNSHNKTFNLQFFLNEQCKDAMNISDFVNSFDLQLSDLESVGDLGYVEGMTKIFLDKLNTMDIYKRPIHCSDTKREILYVKDEDKWEKELRSNPKIRYAIKTLSFKNMKLTNLWSNTYPESKNNESRLNDVYMKLVLQSTGGSGETVDNENKIIRRIAREIFIDKNSIKLLV